MNLMCRNIHSLLEKKKIIILIGKRQDKKLKDDFISFFNIKRYRVFNIETDKLPDLDTKNFIIILCTWDKERCNQILNKTGMRYKRDYVLAEDLFESIDLDIVRDCRKLYAYVRGGG